MNSCVWHRVQRTNDEMACIVTWNTTNEKQHKAAKLMFEEMRKEEFLILRASGQIKVDRFDEIIDGSFTSIHPSSSNEHAP